jgi:multicomponent K+:H+ antiporter subunit A
VKSPLLSTVARVILPPMLLVAAWLLLRGHNQPGGGFIAGLMTAAAFVLQYVATDRGRAGDALPFRPALLIPIGLALATTTGLGALLAGQPFLTSAIAHAHVPLLGELHLSTAVLFDLGVYLVVTGVTLTILLAIEE